ncbi:hypothetical protein IAT38_000744 [Cryptococcus sp. DSM 104549]
MASPYDYFPHWLDVDSCTLWAVALALASGWFVFVLIRYATVLHHVRDLPIIQCLFFSFDPGLRTRVPHIPFVFPVKHFTVYNPWSKYATAHSDLIALPLLSSGVPAYIISSPITAAYVNSRTSIFTRPIHLPRYWALNVFGTQIIATQNGAEHKRHRSVVKGCFGERTMEGVWEKMAESMEDMTGRRREDGMVEDTREALIKLTLLVIGGIGFNIAIPWDIPETHSGLMPFYEALDVAEKSIVTRILLPSWLLRILPSTKLRRYAQAERDFLTHLYAMYHAKRAELQAEALSLPKGETLETPKDLLGALVHSQLGAEEEARLQGGDEKVAGLSESEIISNMWIMIVAGHETGGHCLTFTLGYLALYPEWQDEIYAEIKSACGDDLPTIRDMSRLPLCLAACTEALRLRDLAAATIRQASVDALVPYTTWTSPTPDNPHPTITPRTHLIKAGSLVVIDSSAGQINPFAWGSDSFSFNPRRHLAKDCPPFLGFSLGPRQCIGKRFAEVEMTAFVSNLVRDWRVEPVEAYVGETREEMKKRMIDSATEEITFTPAKFALRFIKR